MSFIFYMNVGPTFLIIKIMIFLKDIIQRLFTVKDCFSDERYCRWLSCYLTSYLPIILINLEIKDSNKLEVSYAASYKDLECDTTLKYRSILQSIPETLTLRLNTMECINTGVCSLDRVVVTDCTKRQKRSISDLTAGINVSLSCDPASRTLCDIENYESKTFEVFFIPK